MSNNNCYYEPHCTSDSYNSNISPDNIFPLEKVNNSSYFSVYHDLEDLHNENENIERILPTNSLKILSQNVRSIGKNEDELFSDLIELEFQIVALQETWLSNLTEQAYNCCDSHYGLFQSRQTPYGGVGFLINKSISAYTINALTRTNEDIECIFISVLHDKERFVIGSIYRPRYSKMAKFIDELCNVLTFIDSNYQSANVYLCGDMNINLFLECESLHIQNYVNLLLCHGLTPLIRRATRVATRSATLIDHIWSNDVNLMSSGIIRSKVSDHYATFATRKCELPRSTEVFEYVTFRNMSQSNKLLFSQSLAEISWEEVLHCSSMDASYDLFYSKLKKLYDECFPVCKKRKKSLDVRKPYIDEYIRSLIKEKHRVAKLHSRWPIRYASQYKQCRNLVTNAIKTAKRNYYQNKLKDNERDPAQMWMTIRNVLGTQGRSKLEVESLQVNDTSITNSEDIANAFNNYFSSIGQTLSSEFQSDNYDYSSYNNVLSSAVFRFQPVTEDDLNKIISSMKMTGGGYDGLPMFVFKNYSRTFIQVLTRLCNLSMTTGMFPSSLSIVKVKCLFKSGDRRNLSNYRPISLLPSFGKILEKVIESQLVKHLESNFLLTGAQFGFRKGRSTEHAVHSLVRNIHNDMNDGKFVMGIFLDLKKAFDSLDRKILLEKLKWYGILNKEWEWFASYLCNRKQFTEYKDFTSALKCVEFGVPQGGVISPLLFLIFINDIVHCCFEARFILYADDTNVYLSSKNIDRIFLLANEALRQCEAWFKANKLTLNASKSQYLIFHRKQKTVPLFSHKLYSNNVELNRVYNTKFLGVILDANLTWDLHISNVARKLAKYAPLIRKLRNLLTHKALLLIYNCLVYSNMIYLNSVWGYCSQSASNPLIITQKKIVRAIAGARRNSHTQALYSHYRLLNFKSINKYMVAIFVYKCLESADFNNWFIHRQSGYITRDLVQQSLFVPQIRNVHTEQCIDYRGPIIWNSVPFTMYEEPYNTFKFMYKSFLLMQQNV